MDSLQAIVLSRRLPFELHTLCKIQHEAVAQTSSATDKRVEALTSKRINDSSLYTCLKQEFSRIQTTFEGGEERALSKGV